MPTSDQKKIDLNKTSSRGIDNPFSPEDEAIADELQAEIVAAGGFEAWEKLQQEKGE